jgi:hypothetical protein
MCKCTIASSQLLPLCESRHADITHTGPSLNVASASAVAIINTFLSRCPAPGWLSASPRENCPKIQIRVMLDYGLSEISTLSLLEYHFNSISNNLPFVDDMSFKIDSSRP